MRFPFAPTGFPPRIEGKVACTAAIAGLMHAVIDVVWSNVEIFPALDPSLVFVTASSSAVAAGGAPYANSYCIQMRIRDGLIVEHTEYFNPLPVIAVYLSGKAGVSTEEPSALSPGG